MIFGSMALPRKEKIENTRNELCLSKGECL